MPTAAPQLLLDPVEPHIGLREEYIHSEPVTLVMHEKLFHFSNDDFIVSDPSHNDLLRVSVKGMSVRDKKHVMSMDGIPLYALRQKMMALKHKTIVEDNEGNELFSIDEQWSWKSKLQCTVPSASGPVHLNIIGKALKYSADIKLDDGTVVVVISHELFGSMEAACKNRQTYYVTVAPGVDLSLMVVICLAFDDLKKVEGYMHGA